MAIAFDSSAQGSTGSATTLSITHTCTGSNLKLFVSVLYAGANSISSVTYNSIAMTQVDSTATQAGVRNSLFYLDNPSTGANSIVVTLGGSATSIKLDSASYTGTQTGIDNHTGGGNGAASSLSLTLTPALDNCWLVMSCSGGNNQAISSNNASTTTRNTQNDANGADCIADTNGVIHPAASTTLSIKQTSGSNMAGVLASFAPFDVSPRYWVGGTGTWDASSTTHWSASSGGSSGASAPVIGTTNIIFDGNSGGGTATLGANFSGVALTFTGYTGTFAQSTFTLTLTGNLTLASGMTWSGSGADTLGGSLTLVSGMTNSYTGSITFNSTTSGNTITNGGITFGSAITFNGVGGVWTLQDNLNSTLTLTITNGTVNFNGKNISVTTVTNAGSLTLGSGTITLTGTGTAWSNSGTVIANTSTINFTNSSSSSKTFSGGGVTYSNLTFTSGSSGTYTVSGNNTFNNFYHTGAGTGTLNITGSNTFADLRIDTPPHTVNFTAGTTQTLQTFTVSGTAGNLITLQSSSSGKPWYMHKSTTGTISCDYLSLQDSYVN